MTTAMKYPYWLVFLLALDRLGAAWIFNRPDICISSLCWVARDRSFTAKAALQTLDMYFWQPPLLRAIGAALEFIQPGHCANSRASDIKTSKSATQLLTGIYT